MRGSRDGRSSPDKISRAYVLNKRLEDIFALIAQRRTQFIQIETNAFGIFFVRVVDQNSGAIA